MIPCLRRFGIKFYAYNPLLGGMLTGRYAYDQQAGSGRFNETTVQGQKYRARFWHPIFFTSIQKLQDLAHELAIPMTQLAHRWLVHHSKLQADDGCYD